MTNITFCNIIGLDMETVANTFGQELRRLRREGKIKYTQSQLAKLSGVTPGYISQLENNDRKPSPSVVRELSRHLSVNANHLFMKLGIVEMDLVSTFANNREQVKKQMSTLADEQIEEIASYLTYLNFKNAVLH